MKILYSGATKDGGEQLNPDLSLGGLVSGSEIPNDLLGNIFSVASLLSIQNKRRETKMIVIKNDEGDPVNSLKFKFNLDSDSICNYKVAFVFPKITSTNVCFEQITNSAALPYYAEFIDIVNDQEITVSELANGAYLGIWVSREFNYDSLDLKKKTQDEWLAELAIMDIQNGEPVEKNIVENFSFTLTYNIGESSSSDSNSSSNSI